VSIENQDIENLRLPFALAPRFAKQLGRAAEEMSFADAVVETLSDSGITIELEGDTPPTNDGLLVASDHGQRIEPLLVQAAMSEANRDSSHVIAMPISFAGKIMQASGERGNELVIPVIPTTFSDQYKPTVKDDPRGVYRKFLYPQVLNQPVTKLRAINERALDTAAGHLVDGRAVTIFPSGGSAELEWRAGIGEMARRLPSESRATTEVALFQPDPFSVKRVAGALALYEVGIRPKKQTLIIRNVNAGKVEDIYPSNDTMKTYSYGFTQAVRGAYKQHFKR